jgi:cytochrome c553
VGRRVGACLVAAATGSAWIVGPAAAQTSPAGRLLASNCYQCHGTNGKGPGFDMLAGKSAQSLYDELVEMRAGKEGTGLMQRHSLGYTDAQLRLIADWLSKQR